MNKALFVIITKGKTTVDVRVCRLDDNQAKERPNEKAMKIAMQDAFLFVTYSVILHKERKTKGIATRYSYAFCSHKLCGLYVMQTHLANFFQSDFFESVRVRVSSTKYMR